MRIANSLSALSLIFLIACTSTKAPQNPQQQRHDAPETVMVTYHVKSGMEAVMEDALARAWVIYRKEKLVFAEPHTIVQYQDADGKSRIVEIFTWVNHVAPEKAPESVKQIWAQMQGLCPPHNGHNGLEGGEVELLVPKNK